MSNTCLHKEPTYSIDPFHLVANNVDGTGLMAGIGLQRQHSHNLLLHHGNVKHLFASICMSSDPRLDRTSRCAHVTLLISMNK